MNNNNIVTIDEFFASMSEEERAAYEKASKEDGPKVVGKIDPSLLDSVNRDPHRNCYHRWTEHPSNYGVMICSECGKENYNSFM